MPDLTGLIGYFGTYQISLVDDPRAKGGDGKRWLCSCKRGHPRANRGQKRKKGGPRLPYPCNHLTEIWRWAREHKEVHPKLRLTSLGERAADECVCLQGEEPTSLARREDERGPAKPLEQQAPSSMRNRPCPCESGLKWRECHGAKAEPGSPAPKAPKRTPKIPQDQPIPANLFPPGLAPPGAPPAPPKPPGKPPGGGTIPKPPPGPPVVPPPPKVPPAPPSTTPEDKERQMRERVIERTLEKAKADKRTRKIVDAIDIIDDRRRTATRATRAARALEVAAGRKRSAEAKAQRAAAAELRTKAAKLRATANKVAAKLRADRKAEKAKAEKAQAKAKSKKKGKAKR